MNGNSKSASGYMYSGKRSARCDQVLDSIGLRMISCGETRSKSGDLLSDGSGHSQICFVLSGGGMIRNASTSHEIREEMAFLLIPGNDCIYQADRIEPWEYVWMDLAGSACDALLRSIGLSRERPFIRLDQTMLRIVRRTVNELSRGGGGPGDDPLEKELSNIGTLLQIFALLQKGQDPDGEDASSGDPEKLSLADKRERKGQLYVEQAEKYICEHYAEPLRMDDLAQELGITPYYLSHIFKQYRASSPSRFLAQIRIEDSKRLLEQTDWPVGDVAKKSGYPNTLNFSKVFRKIVGCSPSTYRRLRRKRNTETDVGNEWTDEI